jgi:hypothetical protein
LAKHHHIEEFKIMFTGKRRMALTLGVTISVVALSVPLMAKPATSQPVKAAQAALPAKPDAETMAAAARITDQLWPIGTMRRQMEGPMAKFYDGLMDQVMGTKMSDFVPANEIPKSQRQNANQTLMQLAEKSDPHFRERMRITIDVTNREMIPLLEKAEPEMRRVVTLAIARRYSPAQMADMGAFFATPSGQAFAQNWLNLYMEPELFGSFKKIMPDFIKAGPDIAKKVEAATAHLPKPKSLAMETVPGSDDAAMGAEGSATVDAATAQGAADAAAAAMGAAEAEPWDDPANWAPADKAAYDAAAQRADTANAQVETIYMAATERAKARLGAKKAK